MNLEKIAKEVRALTIRILFEAKSGHPGGALSMVEAITLLHCEVMRPQPYYPDNAQDIFILSGGHKWSSLIALWSVLGWIPEKDALTLRKLSSPYQGHPSLRHTPWVWASSGSLGQAASVAVGYALAYKRQGLDKKVFVLVGEGDVNEGNFLESMRLASHFKLSNLTVLVDLNGKQSDRYSKIMVHPVAELEGLGLLVEECLGNNFHSIRSLCTLAGKVHTRPMAIILHTVKGCGVPAWEQDEDGAHGSLTLSDEDLQMALEAING